MIMRMQVMAMAAREAANTATARLSPRASAWGNTRLFHGARGGARFFLFDGAMIITHVWFNSNYGPPPAGSSFRFQLCRERFFRSS